MNEEKNIADTQEAATAAAQDKITDPVKTELDKVKKQDSRSEAEKATFSLKKTAERLKELGGDPRAVLGYDASLDRDDEDDNAPVTIGMLKKIEAEKAQKTSIQLAEAIADADERELTKHYLSTRIIPSGDPQSDLRDARAMVNSIRNSQIAEEVSRTSNQASRDHASSSGAPAKQEAVFEPTAEESYMMQAFKLTKEDVLKARRSEQPR